MHNIYFSNINNKICKIYLLVGYVKLLISADWERCSVSISFKPVLHHVLNDSVSMHECCWFFFPTLHLYTLPP